MEALASRDDIKNLIKTVCDEKSIENYKIKEVKTNQKGEGYLGEIFMVTIADLNSKNHLEIIIKAAFIDEKVRGMVPIRMSFQNEIYFYTDIKTAIDQFEQERGVASVEFMPKCLKVSTEEQQEMLVLENLKSQGFNTFDKKSVLDDSHVRLIFKTYGRFHGFSFAFRDQKPEEFKRITAGFYNVYGEFCKNSMFPNYLVEMGKLVQNLLIPGEDDKIIEKFSKYSDQNIADIFTEIVTQEVDFSAILHGDCWSNNMLFKYEDDDAGKPTDMRLIDFQLLKVGSPVLDLSYFLYSGASKKIFDNLNEYLKLYYDSLSNYVKELGSDPEKLFPFSVLQDHWKKYSRFGMIMALSILKMKLTDKEDLIDFTDNFELDQIHDILSQQKFDEENYNKRIRGLLWHMSEVNAL